MFTSSFLDKEPRQDMVGYEQGRIRVSQKAEMYRVSKGRAFIVVTVEELERWGGGSEFVWVVWISLTTF